MRFEDIVRNNNQNNINREDLLSYFIENKTVLKEGLYKYNLSVEDLSQFIVLYKLGKYYKYLPDELKNNKKILISCCKDNRQLLSSLVNIDLTKEECLTLINQDYFSYNKLDEKYKSNLDCAFAYIIKGGLFSYLKKDIQESFLKNEKVRDEILKTNNIYDFLPEVLKSESKYIQLGMRYKFEYIANCKDSNEELKIFKKSIKGMNSIDLKENLKFINTRYQDKIDFIKVLINSHPNIYFSLSENQKQNKELLEEALNSKNEYIYIFIDKIDFSLLKKSEILSVVINTLDNSYPDKKIPRRIAQLCYDKKMIDVLDYDLSNSHLASLINQKIMQNELKKSNNKQQYKIRKF